jgi:predicted SAM-dependent methyltransferase
VYHPDLIAQDEATLLAQPTFRTLFPKGLTRYSVDDSAALTSQVMQAVDDEGQPTRRQPPARHLRLPLLR